LAKPGKSKTAPSLSREAVLAHLAANPGDTKRDLAKALGVRGEDRMALKRLLRELAEEGLLQRGKKKSFLKAGALPEVAVLEITGTDVDGELLARPVKWEGPDEPPQVVLMPGRDEAGPAPGRGERVLVRIRETKDGLEGRVLKKLGMSAHRVLGVVRHGKPGMGGPRIEPIDRKTRHAFMIDPRDLADVPDGELVVVEPLAGRADGMPRARISEKLGSMNEPKAVSLIAIHAHGIPTVFPDEAIQEAENAKPVILKGRKDWREIPLITIDPDDARDHDDAVWAAPDDDKSNPGGHIVIVAIADVAHYVLPGSALDREAWNRGNSVYFPDRVVPMLPEALSAGLCSLRENEDRAALAVRMVFDANGKKRRHSFERILMRSAARLTYREAQAAFDGNPGEKTKPLMDDIITPVWNAYRAMAAARDARAPLELDLPERRIIIGEDGKVASIAHRDRLESMRVIEECMIQANVAAAESLEKARQPLLYRIHEAPSFEKTAALADYLKTIGVPFAKGQTITPSVFNKLIARAKGTPQEESLNEIVLRTQAQAVYSAENVGHFGLNLQRYAHFTSPIRRYADLVVHRALISGLKLGEGGLSEREVGRLRETAEHISTMERRAMAAERDSIDRYVAAFMSERIGAVFDARISSVTRFGLFLRLADTGADGLLPIRDLGLERFRHDEKRHALIGERTRKSFKLGDILTVRLAEAAPLTGGLRFELAEGAGSALSSQRSARRGSSPDKPGGRARTGSRGKPRKG
jgi:ribonuclease R